MKTVAKLALLSAPFLYAALFPPSVGAQAPLMTGTGPSIEAHAGFEYLQQPIPTSSRIPMYGLDSGATIGVSRHFAVRLDLGYARASDVLASGHHSDILSYLPGLLPICDQPFAGLCSVSCRRSTGHRGHAL